MNSKLLLLIVFILSCKINFAQIPNAGFENWTGNVPDNWYSQTGYSYCAPDSNAHSGSLALKFKNIQGVSQVQTTTLSAGISPVGVAKYPMDSSVVPNYITFYAITNLDSGDVLTINTHLENNHNTVGVVTGTCVSTVSSTYQYYSFPITYMIPNLLPDSASTWFSIRNGTCVPNINPLHIGTYVLIDDVGYDFTTAVEEISGDEIMKVYPNPVEDILNVNYVVNKTSEVEFAFFNVDGRQIKMQRFNQSAGTYTLPFNISEMSAGFYFFAVTSDGGRVVKKIQIVR